DALDQAIADGRIPRELAGIRRVSMEVLRERWGRDDVADGMQRALASRYPGSDEILVGRTAAALSEIWLRNNYPDMAITWGTYPSMASHQGCMRCHDGEHLDDEGEEISMDCESCHVMLAERERDPNILEQLGIQGDR
ncbi:MAG: cytochrome C, partial [Planctomycetota bacterium]|nr:cytochrome C [Planctomycetota bacterium]